MDTRTTHITEQQLLDGLTAGDDRAFTQVYHVLHQRLYFFALRFVGEKDAEDITAESFIQLWKHATAGEHKLMLASMSEVSAFLHVAVRNRCLNTIRNQRLREEKQKEILQALEMQSADDHLLEQVRVELVNMIYAQVGKLPERMREVFLLAYREGLKPAQIAERLGLTVQTVSNQKVSAIKLLKQALQSGPLLGVLLLLVELDAL